MTKDLFLKHLYSQGGKSDLEFNNIKGKVKRIVDTTFTATATMDGYKQGDLLAGIEATFDECGNITIEINKVVIDYDSVEERLKYTSEELAKFKQQQLEEPFSQREDRYIYSAGLCVERRSEDHIEQYEYDEDSNLTSDYNYQFKYDGNGKLIKQCKSEESGGECNFEVEHNDNSITVRGDLYLFKSQDNDCAKYCGDILKISLNAKGRVAEINEYEIKKVLFVKKEVLISSEAFSYNPQGDVSSYTTNSFGSEDGDTISITKYRYQYDQAGNWIEKQAINMEGDTITIRQIEYFE